MRKKFDVLFFDADGTLYDFEKTEKYALAKTFEDFELDFDEAKYLRIFKKVNLKIWKEFELNEITADKLKEERFSRFFKEINITGINPKEFGCKYLDNLAEENQLLPGAKELIEELSSDFRMALITNGLKKVQRKRLYNSELRKYWETIIISEEVGFTKPGKEIFDVAYKAMGISEKEKVLMIGDKLTSDILGGNNYGIDTCWYNPKKEKNKSDIVPTYQISKLYQLKKIVYDKI